MRIPLGGSFIAEIDTLLKNKKTIGGAIIVVGFILGFLAIILDLVLTGEASLNETKLFLMIGGLFISILGAAYIGAGAASAINRQKKQINILKSEMAAKDREIRAQREALEGLSDSRLQGLSETVDKMEFLAKSKEITELPTKSSTQVGALDIGGPVSRGPEKPPEGPKPGVWSRPPETPPPPKPAPPKPSVDLPPPPPKSMVVPSAPPKGVAPTGIPPPPLIPQKPIEGPAKPLPPVSGELIEGPKAGPEEPKKGGPAQMVCPQCKSNIKGKWAICPFCDADLPKTEEESSEDEVSQPLPGGEGEGLSILGLPSKKGEAPKEGSITDVLSEVMRSTAAYGVGDKAGPTSEEGGEEETSEEEGEEETSEEEGEEETSEEEGEEEKAPSDEAEKESETPEPGQAPEKAVVDVKEEPAPVPAPKDPVLETAPIEEGPPKEPDPSPLPAITIPPPPSITTEPAPSKPGPEGPSVCSGCGKTIKPHWRNCPYCKQVLKG